MQAYHSPKHNFVMVVTSRAASRIMKEWFLTLHGQDSDIPKNIDKAISTYTCSNWADGTYVFQVTKHPLSRLVSFFKHSVVTKQRNWEGMGREWTFDRVVRQLVSKTPSDAGCCSQDHKCRLNRIVHSEKLTEDMQGVYKDLGLPGTYNFCRRPNQTAVTEGEYKEPWQLTGHTMRQQRIWPVWQSMYSDELRGLAESIYLSDMRKFGYIPEQPPSPLPVDHRPATVRPVERPVPVLHPNPVSIRVTKRGRPLKVPSPVKKRSKSKSPARSKPKRKPVKKATPTTRTARATRKPTRIGRRR